MRSSCLRIRQERLKGPKSLKVNEYTSQLNQYGSDWKPFASDLIRFVEMTVDLLIKSDASVSSKFLQIPKKTKNCDLYSVIHVDIDGQDGPLHITDLVEETLNEYKSSLDVQNKYVVIKLSKPNSINILTDSKINLKGELYHVDYKAHMKGGPCGEYKVYFRYNKSYIHTRK